MGFHLVVLLCLIYLGFAAEQPVCPAGHTCTPHQQSIVPGGGGSLDFLSTLWESVSWLFPGSIVSWFIAPAGATEGHSAAPTLIGTMCMLILPALLSTFFSGLQIHTYIVPLTKFIRSIVHGEEYCRTIEHKEIRNQYGYVMTDKHVDNRNKILMTAITRHLARLEPTLDLEHARVLLHKSLKSKNAGDGGDTDDDEDGDVRGSVASQLRKFAVSVVPPDDEWVEVQRSPRIEFMLSTVTNTKGGGTEATKGPTITTTTMSLRSRARSTSAVGARSIADKAVSDFIGAAYRAFTKEMRESEDTSGRYMYTPLPKSEGHWKRYKLSEEKSFKTLFFPQKDALLRLIQGFNAKSGKFAIKGYPHKLGLLLHGPPGTGKTSLIKALAQHTGRSIVSIPLSRIKTNQQLMDYVFDQAYAVPGASSGGEGKIKLEFAKSIFVMEDVDAATTVVQKRAGDVDTQGDAELRDSLKRGGEGKGEGTSESKGESKCESKGEGKSGADGAGSSGEGGDTGTPPPPPCPAALSLTRQGSGFSDNAVVAASTTTTDGSAGSLCRSGGTSFANLTKGTPGASGSTCRAADALRVRTAGAVVPVTDPLLSTRSGGDTKTDEKASLAVLPLETSAEPKTTTGEGEEGDAAGDAVSLAGKGDEGKVEKISKESGDSDEGKAEKTSKESSDSEEGGGGGGEGKQKVGSGGSSTGASQDAKDKLDLAGLLNVLDGVVDCPNRIVVMTSNHPEKLDPALIRPGRVNLKLYLGYIELPEAKQMVDHYFGGYQGRHLSEEQMESLEVAWGLIERGGVCLTPAQLEQLCAENDEPGQLCVALSRLGHQMLRQAST